MVATGRPYISAGIVGRRVHEQVIVVAVPTRGATGRLTGVLTGAIRLKSLGQSEQMSGLGFENLEIIDRDSRFLLAGLAPVRNRALLARIKGLGTGDLTDTPGLAGGSNHVVSEAVNPVGAAGTAVVASVWTCPAVSA